MEFYDILTRCLVAKMFTLIYGVLQCIYGANALQDLRFTNIYTITYKIYGLLRAP